MPEQSDGREEIVIPSAVKRPHQTPYTMKVACGLYFALAGISFIFNWVFIGFKQTQIMGLVIDIILWGMATDEGGGWRIILGARTGLTMLSFWYMDGVPGPLRIFLEVYLAAIVILIAWPEKEERKDGAITNAA